MSIVDKGTISSGFRNNQITPIDANKLNQNSSSNQKNQILNDIQKNDVYNDLDIKGPNHLKIIPSSGVIYKSSENKKSGDDVYKNNKGRMSYKEYILLRKKYMEKDYDNNKKNNTIKVYQTEESKNPIKNKEKDDKKNIRSKSKGDKVRNYNNNFKLEKNRDEIIDYKKEKKETKKLYDTNLDENGNKVLNENLFKGRKNEYKPMRKTFTGKFFQRKGSEQKDRRLEVFSNNNNNFNTNDKNAYKSYYGGFKNVKKK